MKLAHIIYCSALHDFMTPPLLHELLEQSRVNNSAQNITGMLMYHEGSIFQALEGEELVITALFKKICQDFRHHRVQKIIMEPIHQREFGQWSMGFIQLSAQELEHMVADFGNLVRQGTGLTDLAEGRAKKLLTAFSDGHWHSRVEGGHIIRRSF